MAAATRGLLLERHRGARRANEASLRRNTPAKWRARFSFTTSTNRGLPSLGASCARSSPLDEPADEERDRRVDRRRDRHLDRSRQIHWRSNDLLALASSTPVERIACARVFVENSRVNVERRKRRARASVAHDAGRQLEASALPCGDPLRRRNAIAPTKKLRAIPADT